MSIKEMLDKTGQFNSLRTARIIRQTTDALSEAHRNGVLHRNLSPENIILTVSESGNEQVKLINFGIVKEKSHKNNLSYKSPEQIEGKSANVASDIFSLGVVTYEMLTKRLPFTGSSVKDLLNSQREGLIIHPTNLRLDLPPEIDKVLDKALNFNFSERYANAHDFGESLDNALTNEKPLDINRDSEIEIIFEDEVVEETNPSSEPSSAQAIDEAVDELPVAADVEFQSESPDNENAVAGITDRESDELIKEKQIAAPSGNSGWVLGTLSVLGALILIAGIWGLWSYVLNSPPEAQIIETPAESVFATPEETVQTSAPAPADIEIPPLPRTVAQPPDTNYFQNSKENVKGELAKNFLGFSLYYPNDWKVNDAEGKFLDISSNASTGTPIEQMLVSYYDSKGTYKSDTELFPSLVEETNKTLKSIVPNYEMISEDKKTVNNGWQAYEVKFKGSGTTGKGENITLWGRRLFIPTARPGMKNGYVITMIVTSLSPDVKNVDDVGVKGELSAILESFEPNQNFKSNFLSYTRSV